MIFKFKLISFFLRLINVKERSIFMKYDKKMIDKIIKLSNDSNEIKYLTFIYLKNFNLKDYSIIDVINLIPKE